MPPGVITSWPSGASVLRWSSGIGARVGRSAANGEPEVEPCPHFRNAWTTSGSWPVRLRKRETLPDTPASGPAAATALRALSPEDATPTTATAASARAIDASAARRFIRLLVPWSRAV
jgi:hypothetical protein